MSAASQSSESRGDLQELFRALGHDPEEDDESTDDPEPDEDSEPEEPEIYDFTDETGYNAGDLRPAYDVLEGSYWLDEDNENVVIADSSWNQVEKILEQDENDQSEEEVDGDSSWKDSIKSYLFDHDSAYMKGGLTGIGSGLVSGALGYGLAADVLLTGGAGAFGWGLGGKIGDYLWGDDSEEEESMEVSEDYDSELAEYSDWDVEVLKMQKYGQAVQEYRDD